MTSSQDQKEKPGVMFKPVTRMKRLSGVIFVSIGQQRPSSVKNRRLGDCNQSRSEWPAWLAARCDLLRATRSLAWVTKRGPDCDLGLHRLVCYINSLLDVTMSGCIGDSIMDCCL